MVVEQDFWLGLSADHKFVACLAAQEAGDSRPLEKRAEGDGLRLLRLLRDGGRRLESQSKLASRERLKGERKLLVGTSRNQISSHRFCWPHLFVDSCMVGVLRALAFGAIFYFSLMSGLAWGRRMSATSRLATTRSRVAIDSLSMSPRRSAIMHVFDEGFRSFYSRRQAVWMAMRMAVWIMERTEADIASAALKSLNALWQVLMLLAPAPFADVKWWCIEEKSI